VIAFFDASALIYLIEGKEPFGSRVRKELAMAARKHADLGAALSRLTWLECRVGPMKANDSATLSAFDAFFARPDLAWVELTKDVVELAAAIRAKHGLRTPDALQAASCLQLGADHLFLTGDRVFRRVGGLNVKVLAASPRAAE
jgi:predicted nucleic acid-binding protein